MRRSLIFFNLLAALCLLPAAALSCTVSGAVEVSRDPENTRAPVPDLSDIVVWLKPEGAAPIQLPSPEHGRLLQKDKMFHPHVLAIRVGTIVDFPNADPIFHNAFSNYDGQLFDVGLYPPGTTRSVRFRRPGVVRVFCNIHPTMSAVILALDTPYFMHAGKDGQYRIPDVPAGTYQLRVFDERATQAPDEAIIIDIAVNESEAVAPVIHLGEAGYVRPPHKNKFGLDYPANSNVPYAGPPQ